MEIHEIKITDGLPSGAPGRLVTVTAFFAPNEAIEMGDVVRLNDTLNEAASGSAISNEQNTEPEEPRKRRKRRTKAEIAADKAAEEAAAASEEEPRRRRRRNTEDDEVTLADIKAAVAELAKAAGSGLASDVVEQWSETDSVDDIPEENFVDCLADLRSEIEKGA